MVSKSAGYGNPLHLEISPNLVFSNFLWRDVGQIHLAKERNQVVVHGTDVVHVSVGADATLNLDFQHTNTFISQRVKADRFLGQTLLFPESRSIINFTSDLLSPFKLSVPSADTSPLAIKQFVTNLPHLAIRPQVQNNFTVTHVVSGFFSGSYVELLD